MPWANMFLSPVIAVFLAGSSSWMAGSSSELERPEFTKVAFIDDGLSNPVGTEHIVINEQGAPGRHLDGLFQFYREHKPHNIKTVVFDVVGDNGRASSEDIVQAIELAITDQVQIINVSLAVERPHEDLKRVIHAATDRGIIVIASTQSGLEKVPSYPAAYDTVLGVYPMRSATEPYWFTNTTGGNIGVIVPPEGGSSLGAVMLSTKLLHCGGHPSLNVAALIDFLSRCAALPQVELVGKTQDP